MMDATNPTVGGESHEWHIGRFQADDESECRLCGVQSDEPLADEPCPQSPKQPEARNDR
jgi:hypothetical protein